MISKFIVGGKLDDSVQHQQFSQIDRFKNLDMLKRCLDIAQLFFDFDSQSPAGIDFTDPAFHGIYGSITAAVNSAKVLNS